MQRPVQTDWETAERKRTYKRIITLLTFGLPLAEAPAPTGTKVDLRLNFLNNLSNTVITPRNQ